VRAIEEMVICTLTSGPSTLVSIVALECVAQSILVFEIYRTIRAMGTAIDVTGAFVVDVWLVSSPTTPAGAELAERIVVGDVFKETLRLVNDDVIQPAQIVEEFLHTDSCFVWCGAHIDDKRVQSWTERTPRFAGMVDHRNSSAGQRVATR
jgi:hypothetical protein